MNDKSEFLHWTNAECFKYDEFQAFWDFEFDHKQSNSKNRSEQSFYAAWNHQQSKIDNLVSLLKEAIECVGFYKSKENWLELREHGSPTIWRTIKYDDCEPILKNGYEVGGKRARQFLDKPELKEWL